MMSCSLIDGHQCYEGTNHHYNQDIFFMDESCYTHVGITVVGNESVMS